MTRFIFTPRFNRFDIACLCAAIVIGERGHLGTGLALLIVGALISAAGEAAIAKVCS